MATVLQILCRRFYNVFQDFAKTINYHRNSSLSTSRGLARFSKSPIRYKTPRRQFRYCVIVELRRNTIIFIICDFCNYADTDNKIQVFKVAAGCTRESYIYTHTHTFILAHIPGRLRWKHNTDASTNRY